MTPAEAPPPRRSTGEMINALARRLHRDRIGTGPLAQLRRMDPLGVPPPVFWSLLAEVSKPGLPPEETEQAWAIILQAMAMMAPDCHDPRTSPGRVLHDSGYPEGRFIRLLRAEGEPLATEVRTLARWSAAKALAFNWTDLADLVLARHGTNPDWADNRAMALARPYFQAAAKTDSQSPAGAEA